MDERPVERGPVVALTASRWCCRGSGGSNDRGWPGVRGAGARPGCDACNPGGGPARTGGVREAKVPDDGAAGPEPAVTRWAATGDFDAFVRARYSALLRDRKSTRLNSSHVEISYAVFCLKKKKKKNKMVSYKKKKDKNKKK